MGAINFFEEFRISFLLPCAEFMDAVDTSILAAIESNGIRVFILPGKLGLRNL
jgi:hypothetical protein